MGKKSMEEPEQAENGFKSLRWREEHRRRLTGSEPRGSEDGIQSLLESESFASKNLFSGFQQLFHIPMVTAQVPRKTLAALFAHFPRGSGYSDSGCGRSSR